ncbi:MAG: phosphoribosylanthranilate isomerase [Verrucomicrobiales bacterium]
MIPRVKICGMTSPAESVAAAIAGADALGFMFFEGSSRFISFAQAREIARELPPFIAKVGVFVNAPRDFVLRSMESSTLDALQFHGEETPEYCAQFPIPVVKAFRVKDASTLDLLPRFSVAAYLLDSYVPGQLGGTGATFNWELASMAKKLNRPVILAGGLTAENIAEAVAKVQPYGVDVSSGVESSPGRKDFARVTEFIARAKQAAA